VFEFIQERISDSFNKTLPQDDAALLLGIVLGLKGDFASDYLEAIQKTGVLHVIAASGMNVTMLTGFLLATFVVFLKRQTALVVCSIALILYAGLAGFQPSIVRAAIMAIFAIGAGLLGRQNTSLLALYIAIFLMLFANPGLLTSVGFQLSVAATAGIILIDPVMKKVKMKWLIEDFRVTLAAQIATLPILIYYFSTYSPISIISNLLILWTIPPLMILGGIAGILSLILPILSVPFLWLAFPLLEYFKIVVLTTASFAEPIEMENIPWTIVIGYYLVLLAVIISLYRKNKIQI
jgi:competence protein ComEC